MTNQIQKNGGKENDTPQKPGNGEMMDVPAFVVQGSSSSNMPEHLTQNHDRHQKQQAQQQQEHQQKKSTKDGEKTDLAQQGDASIDQKKQQQQDDKHQQLDQQDHVGKDQDKSKKNDRQQQPHQQQQAQPQQHQGSATVDVFKGKWQQQIGAAKVMWGKLTDDELLKTEGHAQKLAGLVQERYAIERGEADKQVKAFIEKCKC